MQKDFIGWLSYVNVSLRYSHIVDATILELIFSYIWSVFEYDLITTYVVLLFHASLLEV